jgi:ankyrin repeat protein
MFAIKKNLFEGLPADIQREVCLFFNHEHIKKLSPKFYDNPEDVYWKMKSLNITDEVKPEDTTWRDFYESFVYGRFMRMRHWKHCIDDMVNDEIFLLRHVDIMDQHGWSALMYASYDLDEKYVSILLEAGADPNFQDKDGHSPLIAAVQQCRWDNAVVVKLIAAGANVNHTNNYGNFPLLIAADKGNKDNILLLLNSGTNIHQVNNTNSGLGRNVLIAAASSWEVTEDILKILIEKNIDINYQDARGYTALMKAVRNSGKEIVKILLAAGANTNVVNEYGNTALMMAVERSSKEVVEFLLAAGADTKVVNKYGKTALMMALGYDIKKLLIEASRK